MNYQNVLHSTPLSWVNKILVLAPSLYRMKFEFKAYDCLIIDECESFFTDIFSGLCRGANFEAGIEVFSLLMKTSKKILFLDGFLKNSGLSVAAGYAKSLGEIRLIIARYKIVRGTL